MIRFVLENWFLRELYDFTEFRVFDLVSQFESISRKKIQFCHRKSGILLDKFNSHPWSYRNDQKDLLCFTSVMKCLEMKKVRIFYKSTFLLCALCEAKRKGNTSKIVEFSFSSALLTMYNNAILIIHYAHLRGKLIQIDVAIFDFGPKPNHQQMNLRMIASVCLLSSALV